jgi:hypothetical protein
MRSRQVLLRCLVWAGLPALILSAARVAGAEAGHAAAYGLERRVPAKPFLQMPETESEAAPQLLTLTGAFRDAARLIPDPSLIPYDLNVAFWSDGASKARWVGLPAAKVRYASTGEWTFPSGTVFVKHFEIATNELHPDWMRRLETRLLVCDSTGGVYGVTYKWRSDNRDADLLRTNLTEMIRIETAQGFRTQTWYYPSPADCRSCHTTNAGGVLGVKTRQLNRALTYASGITDNQLRAWNHLDLFEPALREEEISRLPALVAPDDKSIDLETRARSYLDANCSQCHRPGGVVSYFDARFDTPLPKQNLVDAPVVGTKQPAEQGKLTVLASGPDDVSL